MATAFKHPAAVAPAPDVLAILARFDRTQLEGFIAVAIDLADALDGDPDVEANGDELDGSKDAEDEYGLRATRWSGPGCPVGDQDACSAGEDLGDTSALVFAHGSLLGDDDHEMSVQPVTLNER